MCAWWWLCFISLTMPPNGTRSARVTSPRVAPVFDADLEAEQPSIVTRDVPGPPPDAPRLPLRALSAAALFKHVDCLEHIRVVVPNDDEVMRIVADGGRDGAVCNVAPPQNA